MFAESQTPDSNYQDPNVEGSFRFNPGLDKRGSVKAFSSMPSEPAAGEQLESS